MILSDVAIKNRATVLVLALLVVIAGSYSYRALPREAAPDVPIPIVMVTTAYEGVSPEDIESSVTIKIENELSGLKGVKDITSTSAEGISVITIQFRPDVVIEDALQYVRDRVDLAKAELPIDAEEPSIKEINIADMPIMMVSISGDISPIRLKNIAERLEDEVELVPGVLNVDVVGALEREIRLEINADRLTAYNLSLAEILALIPSENVNISAGGLDTEGMKFNVRVPAEFVDPGEVDSLLLAVRGGIPIYLSDVATVSDTFKDRLTYSRLDSKDSITLTVQKRVGADIIPISDAVKRVVKEGRRIAPKGVRLEVTFDVAKYIRQMVSDLENNILSGLLLVVAVLVLFMGFRTSAIVALAIPMSMLMSFAIILALGYTLNMIVLFSLVLSLGMLVDNAIVIVENIYRHMQMGHSRVRAAILGAREVAWPVITSTGTTCAAFFPLLFWPDIMGDFMKYLPIGVIITLTSSLFVALIVNPTVCAVIAPGGASGPRHDSRFLRAYRSILDLALRHRTATVMLCVLLLIGVIALQAQYGTGFEYFPESDPDRAMINLRLPQGTNIRETNRLMRVVEERISPYLTAEKNRELKHMVTNVGASNEGNAIFGGGSSGPHVGSMTLVFQDYEVRARPSVETLVEIRDLLTDITGAEVKVEKEKDGPPTGAAVTVRIAGKDFNTLQTLSEQSKRMIADVPGLVNLRSDLESARPELVFRVDRRRAMLLGVNTAAIGRFLKTAIFGSNVGTYRQFNDEYDITVRLPLERRVGVQDVFSLRVPNVFGESVPLSSLGDLEYQGGFGTINRLNQKRVVTITADTENRASNLVLADVQKRLATLPLPPEYQIKYAGEKEDQDRDAAFLGRALLIALILIVLILVAQFNSFQVPLIIISTVLLSMIGVLVGLLICRIPFGLIMTGIGVISLAGVVVNNAIVLLAYTRQLQKEGVDLIEAAGRAGQTRLRPVLLTATTTVLGLIPMATGISFDFRNMKLETASMSSQWWNSMAIAVIFGLAFATVLTLVFVPAVYVSLYRLGRKFGFDSLDLEEDEHAATPPPLPRGEIDTDREDVV
jgi:multidrug efflux pump